LDALLSQKISIVSQFLNTKIAQLAFEMPDDFLIKNGNYKHILKETYKNSLPTEIINRKMRIGFYTPMQNWLVQQRHFLENIINSDICGDSQIFNKKELLNEWNRMITNKTYFDWRFWRWISVIKWLEVFEMKNA
jgi:asparagine synthetase B (glutamine-hydrolysing)